MIAYNVYLKNKLIDTVFYNSIQDKEEIKKSLINHDGYDINIVVRKKRKYNNETQNK